MVNGCTSSLSAILIPPPRIRLYSLTLANPCCPFTHRNPRVYLSNCGRTRRPQFQVMSSSSGSGSLKEVPLGVDMENEDEYVFQSKLLQQFSSICSIDKAWTFSSNSGNASEGMFIVSQPNLLANKKKKFILSAHISKGNGSPVNFHWSPFPAEMNGVSTIVPSPSGSKLLVVRNPENDSPTRFEIWGQSQLEKEFQIPQSVHGSVYAESWFEGISWNSNETFIAYVAEVPAPLKPTFNATGYKKGGSTEKDWSSWKGQGDLEEEWGETYAGKRQPGLFVISLESGEVRSVKGIPKPLSVGQVVWSPVVEGIEQYLVFVGWSAEPRKLGIKYCYNRKCALFAIRTPFHQEAKQTELSKEAVEDSPVYNLSQSLSSAVYPRFSPDGKYLIFLSAKTAVDSGAHNATNSLHRLDWPEDGNLSRLASIIDVIPVVLNSEDGAFPGLYCSAMLAFPWLSDGHTLILSSLWGSIEVILAVDTLSGKISRVSPIESNSSWSLLTLKGDEVIAVSSSPTNIPQIKYGFPSANASWIWSDIANPIFSCSKEVEVSLSSLRFDILKIPVKNASDCKTVGASKPFEAIFVSSKSTNGARNPLIVMLHGGPHSASTTTFSKALAFLASLGFNLLIVNYRGSLGFGEEALQSVLGKIGSQDVTDVLTAIDHVINLGIADPSKIAVLGGSHGGFLTTHLIGQAPDRFVAAAARNPVCNLELMVGTTDIPDWCFVEAYGSTGKDIYTEAPSPDQLNLLHSKSPISHLSKVKTPTLFLLGAKDLRVPFSNGLQYARALKEKGVECKIIIFPEDVHGIDKPQSDFESFLNIGVWFKKHCT